MRQRTLLWAVLFAILTVFTLPTIPALAAEKIPSERLLPPDVMAYLRIPSVPELKSQWGKSLFGQLRDDRELSEFWEDVDTQMKQISDALEKQVGVSLDDLLAIPEGEVAVAVVQHLGKKPSFVALLDFGENRETVDTLLKSAEDSLTEKDAKKSVEEFEDTKIIVYEMASKKEGDDQDENKSTKKNRFAYFVRDSFVTFGSHPDILKEIIARWDGEHEQTFAKNKIHQYISKRTKGDDSKPVLYWYVNPIGLIRNAVSTLGQGNLQAQMFIGFMPVLGLGQLKGVGGSYAMATGKFDSVSRTFIYVDQPTSGLLNVFQFPSTDQAPPKWVPANVSAYQAVNWDVAGAYSAIETLFDTFQGPGTFSKIIDQLADQEGGPMVHLKKDLIDQFNGQIHVVNKSSEETDETSQMQKFLIAMDIKDSDKLKSVLSSLAKTPGFPGKTREFRGTTIYEISTPGIGGVQQGPIGIAITNDHLMITSDVSMLEGVLRADKDQDTLADSALYKKIAGQFPEKTSILGFQRQDAQSKTAYNLLRSGAVDSIEGLDFTKLPPFRVIQKYLPATGNYAVPDEHGALIMSFSLSNTGN